MFASKEEAIDVNKNITYMAHINTTCFGER